MAKTTANLSLKDVHPRELKTLVKDVPTLPVIYQKLFAMMQDENIAIPQVADVITNDQALTSKILRLVNSAFYGYRKEIRTISRAVIILGFRAVRNAALAISVFDYFKGDEGDECCDMRRFWEHSIAVGSIARVLSKSTIPGLEEEAFVVGLLHDVGKLIMKSTFPADFDEVADHLRQHGGSWLDAEKKLLGINHAQIGKAVFRSWDFPPTIVESIQFHHDSPASSSHPQMASLVHISDFLAHRGRRDFPVGTSPEHYEEEALTSLGITIEEAMAPVDTYTEEIARALDLLKLVED